MVKKTDLFLISKAFIPRLTALNRVGQKVYSCEYVKHSFLLPLLFINFHTNNCKPTFCTALYVSKAWIQCCSDLNISATFEKQ